MEWTKIPTDLLQNRLSDKEIIAITKYQLLWAILERRPSKDTCLRYMTSKQLQQALNYETAIERRVNSDIKSVESNRKRQKLFYEKNQELKEKPNGYTNCNNNSNNDSYSTNTDKIREDKIREDKSEKENNKEKDKKYGELNNVRLTEEQYLSLKEKHSNIDEAIEVVDTWLGTSGSKYKNKNHYAYFKSNSWVWDRVKPKEDDKYDTSWLDKYEITN